MGLLLALPSITACAGDGDATKKQLASMETQLTAMQADHDRVEERLEALELQSAVQSRPTAKRQRAASGIERPRLKIIRLGPDGEVGSSSNPPKRPSNEGSGALEDASETSGAPNRAEPETEPARPVIRGQGDRVIKTEGETSRRERTQGDSDASLALVRSERYIEAIRGFRMLLARQSCHRAIGPQAQLAAHVVRHRPMTRRAERSALR